MAPAYQNGATLSKLLGQSSAVSESQVEEGRGAWLTGVRVNPSRPVLELNFRRGAGSCRFFAEEPYFSIPCGKIKGKKVQSFHGE
jgi:hypothetical protein